MGDETIVNIPDDIAYPAKLMKTLYDDPKTRPGLLKLVKQYAPNVRIPEVDTPNEVAGALKPLIDQINTDRQERQAEKLERQAEKDREKVMKRADLGLSSEDLPEVEKTMKEGQIASLETAAELYSHRKRAAAPRGGYVGNTFDIGGGKEYLSTLMKTPKEGLKQVALREADRIFHELRGGRQ
jgi:hypothetical protein